VLAFTGLGSIVGPVVCGVLTNYGGRQCPFFVLAGLIVIDLLLRVLLIEKPLDEEGVNRQPMSFFQGYRCLLCDIEISSLLFVNFVNSFVAMVCMARIPTPTRSSYADYLICQGNGGVDCFTHRRTVPL
jgi:MFS family permease